MVALVRALKSCGGTLEVGMNVVGCDFAGIRCHLCEAR